MKKDSLLLVILLLLSISLQAQITKHSNSIKINKTTADLKIQQGDEATFQFSLKKDIYYSIVVEQKGIDLGITLKDKFGRKIQEMDSPNGKFGPEKIEFSPDSTAGFILSVKTINDTDNSSKGEYTLSVKESPTSLRTLSYKSLTEDFDILKNAYLETRIGLWYNSYKQFDSLCNVQRSKIKDKMTALDFYQIVAPVTTYTKEGHSAIRISDETNSYIKQKGKFFPFLIKIIDEKVYILNDLEHFKTKGLIISKINGNDINQIIEKFLSIEPSDGYNLTSKQRWIENSFSKYYLRFFEAQPSAFNIELIDPKSNEKITHQVSGFSFKQFSRLTQNAAKSIPNYSFTETATLKLDTISSTATLTFNSFATRSYKEGRIGFKQFLEQSFKSISDNKIQNLIIDIRKNEGGAQGMEDHLMSYLIEKQYVKYKYVEIPSFTYSFLQYTTDKDKKSQDDFEKNLRSEFYLSKDGRYLDIPEKYKGDAPQKNAFKGNIYILISGLTFSGGSEFAALAKNHTQAKFIGEETGGGYYGNSSGDFIQFILPNSQLTGRIPVMKFVVDVKENGIPFGHGVLPDYPIKARIDDYLAGYDAEMEFVKSLIKK